MTRRPSAACRAPRCTRWRASRTRSRPRRPPGARASRRPPPRPGGPPGGGAPPPIRPADVAEFVRGLDNERVIIEGAGGLLVHFDDDGGTIADVAQLLDAPVLVVARAGLGTLNHTA